MIAAVAYALAYVATLFPPIVAFLRYDPKDVVILLGGFLYGPLSAVAVSAVVSLLEMVTISPEGPIGTLMNIVSTTSFVCVASIVYQRRKTLDGAVIGLVLGVLFMTGIMTLWNYLIVPIYQGVPRHVVVGMLLPVFIPFNLIKGSINAVLTMLLFKPIVVALHKSGLIEPAIIGNRSSKIKWIFIAATLVVVTAILLLVNM